MIVIVPKLPVNSPAAGKVSSRPPCLWLRHFMLRKIKALFLLRLQRFPRVTRSTDAESESIPTSTVIGFTVNVHGEDFRFRGLLNTLSDAI